jgi:hypothetical protein
MIMHVFIRGYCLSGNVQVVAFEDFKRLSTGTSLAEVKVSGDVLSSFFSRIFHLLFIFQAAGKWRQEGKGYEMQDGMPKFIAWTNGTCCCSRIYRRYGSFPIQCDEGS